MSKIEELNSHIQKAKVYVKSPEDAPKGATVETGKKGGHYYESGEKKGKEEAKTKKTEALLSDEEIATVIRDMEEGAPFKVGSRLFVKSADLMRKKGMEQHQINGLRKLFGSDKNTEGELLSPETVLIQMYYAKKMGYDWKSLFDRINKDFVVDSASYDEFNKPEDFDEFLDRIEKEWDSVIPVSHLDTLSEVIQDLFDSKEITVYRGCSSGKIGELGEGGQIRFSSLFPVSRWTLCPKIASLFARQKKKGIVVKAKITADKIKYMDFISYNGCLANECEVGIDHRDIVGQIWDGKVTEKIKKAMLELDITSEQNWIAATRKKEIKKSSDSSLKEQIDFASKLTGINHFIVTGLDDSFSKDAQEKLNAYTKENNIQIAIELATDGQELVVDRIKLLKDIKKAEDNIFGIFTPPKIRMPFFEDNFNAKDLWDRWGRDKLSRGSKISIEPKYDGFRAILTKKAGIIRLWLVESQQDRAIILDDLIEKLLTIPFDFAIDGVLKTDIDILNDSFQIASTYEYIMFDALCLDSDITDYSQEYRRGKLEELCKSNFVGIKKFSLGRAEIVENRAEFFSAVEKLLNAGKSVIAKDTSGRYTFGETDNVNRIRKRAEVKVMVLDKEMGEDGKWIYTCGVLS